MEGTELRFSGVVCVGLVGGLGTNLLLVLNWPIDRCVVFALPSTFPRLSAASRVLRAAVGLHTRPLGFRRHIPERSRGRDGETMNRRRNLDHGAPCQIDAGEGFSKRVFVTRRGTVIPGSRPSGEPHSTYSKETSELRSSMPDAQRRLARMNVSQKLEEF